VGGARPASSTQLNPYARGQLFEIEDENRWESSFSRDIVNRRNFDASTREGYLGLIGTAFYAPHARDYAELKAKAAKDDGFAVRRADTREAVDIDHVTLAERLRHHLWKPEHKFANPEGVGELERRHVVVTDRLFVGKESDEVLDEIEQLADGELAGERAGPYAQGSVAPLLAGPNGTEIAKRAKITKERADAIIGGAKVRKALRDRIVQAADAEPLRKTNPLVGEKADLLEMCARTGITFRRLKSFQLNRATPRLEEAVKITDALMGGFDVEHAQRNAHITKPSQIQLEAMKKLAVREKRVKLVARLSEINDDDLVARRMVTAKRTFEDARGLLGALKRGWRVEEMDLKAAEMTVRNGERQRLSPESKRQAANRSGA
jgi:hypothetical protein